ncbi:somatomedin-B and thrombospondin type-1 domain-containing protein [Chanos chanos]|uniref:Somatomedin-B and thrombospondin type-1 domain-containing protein n=1 Tax=Chanos chanos TaxID=29144 RepID=A0A6J2VRB0_CHACN|nr:somatomedin-B and thrombospondin type-1 domain-containing protein-like [Chanos chanos]
MGKLGGQSYWEAPFTAMSPYNCVRLWMFCVLACLGTLLPRTECGCQDAGFCCSGRNRSCVSTGWRTDRSYGTCYCDQTCLLTLDCCHDYDLACPAVSCVVSEWSMWSGCAEPCRATVRLRQRQVVREPRNGGQPCPPLQQSAGCAEYQQNQQHCLRSLVPALITAGGYGNARKKRQVSDSQEATGYCVEFEVTSLMSGCQQSVSEHTRWMQYLREGHQVCVECQPPALAPGQRYCSGDGEKMDENSGQSLQWQAVGNSRCRGLWRRVRRREACTCPTVHSFLFI